MIAYFHRVVGADKSIVADIHIVADFYSDFIVAFYLVSSKFRADSYAAIGADINIVANTDIFFIGAV